MCILFVVIGATLQALTEAALEEIERQEAAMETIDAADALDKHVVEEISGGETWLCLRLYVILGLYVKLYPTVLVRFWYGRTCSHPVKLTARPYCCFHSHISRHVFNDEVKR